MSTIVYGSQLREHVDWASIKILKRGREWRGVVVVQGTGYGLDLKTMGRDAHSIFVGCACQL